MTSIILLLLICLIHLSTSLKCRNMAIKSTKQFAENPKSIRGAQFSSKSKYIQSAVTIGLSSFILTQRRVSADDSLASNQLRGFQTKSGLKYFDFKTGIPNTTPEYGQLVSFLYSGYYRPNGNGELDMFDNNVKNNEPFLHKHGNGRILRGIDEALHTMNVGGKRRIIIPKSIGYTEIGLGPVPKTPSGRRKLGQIIDKVEQDQGELVFDIELLMAADDENDQGYYNDEAISADDIRELVRRNNESLKARGEISDSDATTFETNQPTK